MEFWELIKYIFLGLLQGITEPIPVSSSGHLVIARELFGIEASGLSFEIFSPMTSLSSSPITPTGIVAMIRYIVYLASVTASVSLAR